MHINNGGKNCDQSRCNQFMTYHHLFKWSIYFVIYFIFYSAFIFVTFTLYDFCIYLLIVIYSHVMSLYKTFIVYLLECYNIVKMFHHIFWKMKRSLFMCFIKKKTFSCYAVMCPYHTLHISIWGPSWSWSYGSWIYNYLCDQCLSPLKSRVWILLLQFPPPIKLSAMI